jgi:hypothetical protein
MSLARFADKNAPAAPTVAEERCDFCAQRLDDDHAHVADLRERRILCSCRPCALLFSAAGAAQGRYKTVPRRYVRVEGFELSSKQWEDLQIPVELVFFFYSTSSGKLVAFYPSPAGATESQLPLGAWDGMTGQFEILRSIEPDVEALLVNRSRDGLQRGYIVPIDMCYVLVGLIRTTWKGFGGGEEAHRAVDEFFGTVESLCEKNP